MSKKKTLSAGKMSPTGSQGDLHATSFGSSKKKKDHLKVFEKKMGEKLMWNKMLSGAKGSGNKQAGDKRKSVLVPNTVGPLNMSESKSGLKKTVTLGQTYKSTLKTNQVKP
jgi:hypothetical protein